MKKNLKKALSMFLAVVMMFALGVTAFAISVEDAKDIAVNDAGVVALRFTEANYDKEDGKYEIEFQALNGEYDYEITNDGKIVAVSVEYYDLVTGAEKKISADEAKAKAFEFYGKSDVRAIKVEYDAEDNDYEIDFIDGAKKYEIEVSAFDGDITSKSYEVIANGNETIASFIAFIEEIINFLSALFR